MLDIRQYMLEAERTSASGVWVFRPKLGLPHLLGDHIVW